MAFNATRPLEPQSAAEKAVSVIGFGYDISLDIRLSSCKLRLIELDRTLTRDLVLPGGIVVSDVSTSIQSDKGERTRFCSDVLSFNQMSEHFNKEMSLSGKIPSGMFNQMFGFKGCWQKDASSTKSLAFDGWFISLYNIELSRSQIILSECVKSDVPSTWDPVALSEFIEKYGTHVVTGVKMGGKDVIYMKQLQNSHLQPTEFLKLIKQLADERFSEDATGTVISKSDELTPNIKEEHFAALGINFINSMQPPIKFHSKNKDLMSLGIRRGGVDVGQSHNQWLSSVSQSPNVISMSFVPITSLLSGVRGIGFLSHAINLYLRYKPKIEELLQFLEFQLPRQWAPMYGDLPLGPQRKGVASPALQFSFMGPKLYVNTEKVDSGNRPVTGLRLYLEGKKRNRLGIHLQHLSTLPKTLQLSDDHSLKLTNEPFEKAYMEPVNWSIFSHVYTAPVQYNDACFDESASIVTKAWFEVNVISMKKVLFLRLGFSNVASFMIRRSEWEGPAASSRKSGVMSMLISQTFSAGLKQPPPGKPAKMDLNSAVFPNGPPLPGRGLKMMNFVDTTEMVRGPEDLPGYWAVTGAKLCVENGRISIKVKYSLLAPIMADDTMLM